jgi:GTP-binding protein LepA
MSYIFNSQLYILNLIDTPGHVDFSYEVSRSLAAVEGAILLVDASCGIQAQTLSHGLAALEQNLVLIPVINKVDLLSANVEMCKDELVDMFGFSEEEIILASGKTGQGVEEILKAVVEKIPAPKIEKEKPLRALIFDSFFDPFKGVVAEIRVIDGEIPQVGSKIYFLGTKAWGEVLEKGYFGPGLIPAQNLESGEIGYLATGVKQADLVKVGDTVSQVLHCQPLPGYKKVKPMVYVGLYPLQQSNFGEVKEILNKFRLSDPAFVFEIEHSQALGAGFRCGFLGLLHAEVVQQRLSEEFGLNLLATTPSVEYLVDGKEIKNPSELLTLDLIKEPWAILKIFTPQAYLGKVMDLVAEKRGIYKNQIYYGSQVELTYEMPLSEMIIDFYDRLKSSSSGFASLDWDFLEFREMDGVKLDFLVAGEKVDALSMIVTKDKAEYVGRRVVEKLKDVLPRQNFEIPIQAAVGGKIVARETVKAFRKDVIEKLYGGDRTRKDKLLEKQKKGKKKMKMIGKVEIPQEAFLSILKN